MNIDSKLQERTWCLQWDGRGAALPSSTRSHRVPLQESTPCSFQNIRGPKTVFSVTPILVHNAACDHWAAKSKSKYALIRGPVKISRWSENSSITAASRGVASTSIVRASNSIANFKVPIWCTQWSFLSGLSSWYFLEYSSCILIVMWQELERECVRRSGQTSRIVRAFWSCPAPVVMARTILIELQVLEQSGFDMSKFSETLLVKILPHQPRIFACSFEQRSAYQIAWHLDLVMRRLQSVTWEFLSDVSRAWLARFSLIMLRLTSASKVPSLVRKSRLEKSVWSSLTNSSCES